MKRSRRNASGSELAAAKQLAHHIEANAPTVLKLATSVVDGVGYAYAFDEREREPGESLRVLLVALPRSRALELFEREPEFMSEHLHLLREPPLGGVVVFYEGDECGMGWILVNVLPGAGGNA